jgi:hypothetical protein
MTTRYYEDPNPNTHKTNRAKNDFLADTLTQLSDIDHVLSTKRVDEGNDHGWEISLQ